MPSRPSGSRTSTRTSELTSALAGGAVGFATGLVLAQLFGGVHGIMAMLGRITDEEPEMEPRFGAAYDADDPDPDQDFDDEDEDEDDVEDDADGDELGVRVLSAFEDDPTLSLRPIEIAVEPGGIIELSGQVDAAPELEQAVRIAGAVSGVTSVVNRLNVQVAAQQ